MADTLAAELAKASVKDERVVSFQDQGLKLDNAQSAEDIVNAIETCPNMETLCLSGNTLGVAAAQEIANALQSRPTLKFALWKDMYTGRLRSEIPPSLRSLSSAMIIANTQLVELDLSDNAFGPDGAEAIRALLTSPVAYTIQTLKFQNNGLGGGGVIIADCLKQNHKNAQKVGKSLDLRSFIAGRNRLENPGAKALGEAFSLLGTLEQIEVIQNGIQYEGICGLAECIKHSPDLKILNLNDNIMTPKGAIAIAEALPSAKNLQVLNIGDCLVKTEGALAVAKAIKDLKNLKEIVLSFNEIRALGGSAIAKSVSEMSSVKSLSLDGNHFGAEGSKEVEKALGGKLSVLTGLNEDEGIPSDDEEEEEKVEEKNEEKTPQKAEPFVFGKPQPSLVGTDDPNRPFGFSATSFSFSSPSFGDLSSNTTNIFAQKSENKDFAFKGSGKALFSNPGGETTEDNPEHEADVKFEPLVHLEKVEKVNTGEEEETEMYKHRAKIYRFDGAAGAWKERGVGDIRILTNKTTRKSRLLMRRDIILKLCCNHMITKDMDMKSNAGSDKSLVWFTPADFSEDEPKPENLAVKFKTPEICADFLAAFNTAKSGVPEPGSTPEKVAPAKPEPATSTAEPFSFASLAANSEKAAFAAKSPQSSPVKPADSSQYREEYEPDVNFTPLVQLSKVEVETGTEKEETRFSSRSKLYRFDKDSNQWKERGLGDMTILWNKGTGKGRILMRREHILKICCNHAITKEMELKNHQGNDKFLVWHTFADYADEEPKFEQLAAKFKTSEIAADFKKAFNGCQDNIGQVDTSEDPVVESASESISQISTSDAPKPAATTGGFNDFIAKQKDKWTCGTCALKNEKGKTVCIACQTPNPDAPPEAAAAVNKSPSSTPKFSFGMPSTTDTAKSSPSFSFGAPAANPFMSAADSTTGTGGFTFGNTGSTAGQFAFGKPAAGFQFGNVAPAAPATTTSPAKPEEPAKPSPFANFSFGAPPKTTESPVAPTFSFGSGIKTAGVPSPSADVTVDYKAFSDNPSQDELNKITRPDGVKEALDCSSSVTVATFLGKLSRVMSNKSENTTLQIVDTVLSESFSQNQHCPSDLTNELLVIMGLIKSEDKDYKPDLNMENMLRLLSHAVKQSYFPSSNAKIVSAFIKKEKENLSSKINNCTELLGSFQI